MTDIAGPGCKRDEATEQVVKDTGIRLGIDVDLKKATDPDSMALAGVMSTPGLAADGKLVHAGGLPDQARLEARLGT